MHQSHSLVYSKIEDERKEITNLEEVLCGKQYYETISNHTHHQSISNNWRHSLVTLSVRNEGGFDRRISKHLCRCALNPTATRHHCGLVLVAYAG